MRTFSKDFSSRMMSMTHPNQTLAETNVTLKKWKKIWASRDLLACGFILTIALAGCENSTMESAKQAGHTPIISDRDEQAPSQAGSLNPTETKSESNAQPDEKNQTGELQTDSPTAQSSTDPPAKSSGSNAAGIADVTSSGPDPDTDDNVPVETDEPTIQIPASWKRMFKTEVWADIKNKKVVVGGVICFNRGPLEMFACPANTKEHESIVSANALSSHVHAALLLIGAEKGSPAQWDPVYRPATGPIIDVQVRWFDEESKQEVTRPAREMVRDSRTGKSMSHDWVFGGSQIWEDPATGEKVYYGDAGEMICLSNFSTATMDVNVESSQSNDGLLFEAFTENIPPLGTQVYLILTPGETIGPEVDRANKPNDLPENGSGESKNQ
jgi:hypothetical protein